VGAELDDPLYLNAHGVNRQFILLSPEQKTCPLLDAQFSTSRTILRNWIVQNEAALFALTARDAVAGELVNSVFKLSAPADLFDLRAITVEADTTQGTAATAATLATKVDRFLGDEGAWYDDVLIGEMIELAAQTGNVARNPVALRPLRFEKGNFWTAHFGGLYVFQNLDHPALIHAGSRPDGVPLAQVHSLHARNQIARFMDLNGLAEPIVKARGIDSAAILRQKMDFILVDAVTADGVDLAGTSRADMRRLARRHADLLPPEFHALNRLLSWAVDGGPWPTITSDDPAYFYTLRAAQHPDADLVNQLLAELSPKDVRQLFICHKSLFYRTYAGWPAAKQDYVADYLEAEYTADKAGMRAALFGHDAPLAEPQDIIDRVGPWGAVRRP